MKKLFAALLPLVSGLLFALGLGLGGMTQPARVVGFLDFTGDWDPSLAFVMAGAVGVHFLAYRLLPRLRSPIFGGGFGIPTRRDIDPRLVIGAALFGLGWGLGGYCPGPALTSLVTLNADPLIFTAAMLVGMGAFHAYDSWASARAARRAAAVEPPEEVPQRGAA